ncbi:MAG: PDZ domain-containing protein [bacterium]
MKRNLGLAALLALVAVSADAGEGAQCKYGTQECLDYMATKLKTAGWVGVELDHPGGEEYGPMTVTRVVEGSPAEAAGIQAGDLLIAMNGIEFGEGHEEKLQAERATWKPGSSVTWTMQRDGADRNLAITLAPMPADILAAYIGKHMLEHASAELAKAQ